MALPISIFLVFGILHALRVLYNVVTRRKRGTSCRKQMLHAVSIKSASLLIFYVLYLYLVRTVLDVFNCVPTTPPDGQLYLSAVFAPCGVPGGVQMTLVPWAILGIIFYVLGYPAFLLQVGLYRWHTVYMGLALISCFLPAAFLASARPHC